MHWLEPGQVCSSDTERSGSVLLGLARAERSVERGDFEAG
jgi:hypothetical protein